MAKSKHHHQRPKSSSTPPSAPADASGRLSARLPERRHGSLTGWRWWLALAVLGLGIPVLVLGLAEIILRSVGYGYATTFFIKTQDGQSFLSNRKFGWQFYPRETATQPHPVLLPAKSPAGTYRIFVLGESAAAGTPDPAFGFARILEVILRRQHPGARFEVINAAMRGINSHIILPIARECLLLDPDLFLVYMGNNEAIGLHAPEPDAWNLTPHLGLLRWLQWAKSTKLAQFVDGAILSAARPEKSAQQKQDAGFFRRKRLAADDPRRAAVYANFRTNLEEMRDLILRSGARAILSTIAVNLKDCPPLGSLHRPGLTSDELARWEAAYRSGSEAEEAGHLEKALQSFQEALKIDDHFAELHFRTARCYFALGQTQPAHEHFNRARDRDAMQFRADSRLNGIIRDAVSGKEAQGLYFVDIEQAFARSELSDRGIAGEKLFYEHVHFTFDGDHLLATQLAPVVAKALGLPPAQSAPPSRDECANALAYTSWDAFNVLEAMSRMLAKPPFTDQLDHAKRQLSLEQSVSNRLSSFRQADIDRALETYRQAIAERPNDWHLHYNQAGLLADLNQHAAAAAACERAVKLLPEAVTLRIALAASLIHAGRAGDAIAHLQTALALDPEYAPAHQGLAAARSRQSSNQRPASPP